MAGDFSYSPQDRLVGSSAAEKPWGKDNRGPGLREPDAVDPLRNCTSGLLWRAVFAASP